MTSTKLAPIFRKPSDILAQGSWKIFPNELLVFTDSNIEHRSKIAGFDLGNKKFLIKKLYYLRWNIN